MNRQVILSSHSLYLFIYLLFIFSILALVSGFYFNIVYTSNISQADKQPTLLFHFQIIPCAASIFRLLIVIKQNSAAFVETVHFKTLNKADKGVSVVLRHALFSFF